MTPRTGTKVELANANHWGGKAYALYIAKDRTRQTSVYEPWPPLPSAARAVVSHVGPGTVPVAVGVLHVRARVLAVVVAAEVVAELVGYHQAREAVGVD